MCFVCMGNIPRVGLLRAPILRIYISGYFWSLRVYIVHLQTKSTTTLYTFKFLFPEASLAFRASIHTDPHDRYDRRMLDV